MTYSNNHILCIYWNFENWCDSTFSQFHGYDDTTLTQQIFTQETWVFVWTMEKINKMNLMGVDLAAGGRLAEGQVNLITLSSSSVNWGLSNGMSGATVNSLFFSFVSSFCVTSVNKWRHIPRDVTNRVNNCIYMSHVVEINSSISCIRYILRLLFRTIFRVDPK